MMRNNITAETADAVYLTLKELEQIENIKLIDVLNDARDWLIISCCTGQVISDFMQFNSNMILKDEGNGMIVFKKSKTQETIHIPLLSMVSKILERREGKFPNVISNKQYNDQIKFICEIAQITQLINLGLKKTIKPTIEISEKETITYRKCELVNSLIGRRSFAINYYGIIPTSMLLNITGHKDENMLLNYIGLNQNQII
jgi:hypothetical protein